MLPWTGLSSPKQLIPYKELCLLPTSQEQAGSLAAADGSMSQDEQRAAAEAQTLSRALWQVVTACEGSSGRSLRKLPFLAHATSEGLPFPCSCYDFLTAMKAAAERERAAKSELAAW